MDPANPQYMSSSLLQQEKGAEKKTQPNSAKTCPNNCSLLINKEFFKLNFHSHICLVVTLKFSLLDILIFKRVTKKIDVYYF